MSTQAPQPGTVVSDKYRLLSVLGRGGMGTVFEAEHNVSGKHVALKWMHIDTSRDPEASQRFIREAQASARLRHPNVVDVYDVESGGDEAFLVMERLEGELLSDLMERRTEPLHIVIGHLIDAMRGVQAAHAQGIIHRDIKPDNIFLAQINGRETPVAKVLDFGISKVMGTETLAMTRAGAAMGTPQYMSLEQLYGQRDVDGRTDTYAFGVILFEAITGTLPYNADTITELAVKVATTQPPSAKAIRPDLPRSLCDVVEKAMAKDREARHAELGELIDDLQPYTSEGALLAHSEFHEGVRPLGSSRAPANGSGGRRTGLWIALGAAASLLVVGGAIAWQTNDARPARPKSTTGPTPANQPTTIASLGQALPEGQLPPDAKPRHRARATSAPAPVHGDPQAPDKHGGPHLPGTPADGHPVVASGQGQAVPTQVGPTAAPDRNSNTGPAPVPLQAPHPAKPTAQRRTTRPTRAKTASHNAPPRQASAAGQPALQAPQSLTQPTSARSTPAKLQAPQARLPTAQAKSTPRQVSPPPRVPTILPQRGLQFSNVVHLKAAYRNRQMTRADYNAHVRALKVWRKQALIEAKLLYRNRVLDRRAYGERVKTIKHRYAGR